MSGDPEFDDFLKRRRPLFRGDVDDGLEPPAELDRIVLRHARDAIEDERPIRFFGMPRWAAPVAIAATLVLGLSVVFKAGVRPEDRVPEVRVENAAQRIEVTEAAPPAPPPPVLVVSEPPPADGAIVVNLAPPKAVHGEVSGNIRPGAPMVTSNSPAISAETPAWRRDARAWQAEIQRLRASGETARADLEQAEFNRQFRAYAGAPDR